MSPFDITTTLDAQGRLPQTRAAFVRRWMEANAGSEIRLRGGDAKRTPPQVRYYFGFIVRPVSAGLMDAGYMFDKVLASGEVVPVSPSPGRVHSFFKSEFLGCEIVRVGGRDVQIEATTTELSVDEFLDYCERCRTCDLVMEAGIYLPLPGEAGFDKPFRSGKIAEAA